MAPVDDLYLTGDSSRVDLVSWTFGNLDYDQKKKIYIDAENAQRSLSASEARVTVRKLVAGLKAKGLKPGDCVCVHAFNDVSVQRSHQFLERPLRDTSFQCLEEAFGETTDDAR